MRCVRTGKDLVDIFICKTLTELLLEPRRGFITYLCAGKTRYCVTVDVQASST